MMINLFNGKNSFDKQTKDFAIIFVK
jgi:hypothetical protein